MGNWGGSNFGVCGYQNLGTPKHSLKIIEESIHINHLPPNFPHPGHVRFGPLVTPSENAWRGALIEIDCFNLSAAHTQLGIGPMKALELLYIWDALRRERFGPTNGRIMKSHGPHHWFLRVGKGLCRTLCPVSEPWFLAVICGEISWVERENMLGKRHPGENFEILIIDESCALPPMSFALWISTFHHFSYSWLPVNMPTSCSCLVCGFPLNVASQVAWPIAVPTDKELVA